MLPGVAVAEVIAGERTERYAMKSAGLMTAIALGLSVLVGCGQADGMPAIVATVNGEDISRHDLNLRVDQERQNYAEQGVDLDAEPELLTEVQSAVLEELINETLLLGYAADAGITASQEDIDAQYEVLVEQVQGEERLEELLEMQGLGRDELMELIADEVVLRRLQDYEREVRGLVVTEALLQEAYSRYLEIVPDMPPLDEVRPYLIDELERQQFRAVLPELIVTLREGADIEVYL